MLSAFPATIIEARGLKTTIGGKAFDGNAFEALKRLAQERAIHQERTGSGAPFLCGLVGFVGYECGALLEPSAKGPASPFALPDMAFGAYDAAALFDRRARRAFISVRNEKSAARLAEALGSRDPTHLVAFARGPQPFLPREAGEAATAALRRGSRRGRSGAINAGAQLFVPPPSASRTPQAGEEKGGEFFVDLNSNFSADAYRRAVAGAIDMIREGRFFQANLAQQLHAFSPRPVEPFDIFLKIAEGDAPFAALLQYSDGAIISNSPERFFSATPSEQGVRIVAEPVKGTRARGRSVGEDERLAAELMADPKERAENVMIADLARNDLSRVCRDGSIREEAICELSSNGSVHHLVSRISGLLRDDLSSVDVVKALFPCGSVTGAPKVEAMKAIAGFEDRGRGPYCGAIGYIDDRGGADFSVAIRTIILERAGETTRATLPVGGGVTLRSDPQAEYQETLDKARGALAALKMPPLEKGGQGGIRSAP